MPISQQQPSERSFIGCMTGTSVDALDLAILHVSDTLSIGAAASVALPPDLQAALLSLGQPDAASSLDDLGLADAELGEFIGHSVCSFLNQHGLTAADITAIGSHGQTVRHRPGQFTMQIGDPNRIAEITGILTVADFRRRDVAAGGQGAPLVPPFHQALFGQQGFGQQGQAIVLNIGGISNITVLGDALTGFDTGPGNGLMDSWYAHHHPDQSERYDTDGRWAASGAVDADLLQVLLDDPYFKSPPPKSTGREYFNLAWLQGSLENQSPVDVQATLCALTAMSITDAIRSQTSSCERLIVCGGGRLNAELMTKLQAAADYPVVTCEALDVDGDSLEAAAFAWLAHQRINQLPGNSPVVTGANGPRVLGTIFPA